jgi:general secretion pathway protein L
MTAGLLNLPTASWRAGWLDLLHRLGRWYAVEFLDLLPRRTAAWLLGRGQKALALAVEHDVIVMTLMGDGRAELAQERVSRADYGAESIDRFLGGQGLARSDVAIGIRLPDEQLFSRQLVLPLEAASALEDIARQDLARKTPFRLEDIHHGYARSTSNAPGKIVLTQWIVRREFVDAAVAALAIDPSTAAFIDTPSQSDRDGPAPIITLRRDDHRGSSIRKVLIAMSVGTLLLAAVSGGLKYWHQQATIEDLIPKVTAARAKAQRVRAAIDTLDQKQAALLLLRARKVQTPSLLEVWNETTRVLPAHSWLSELRLSEAPDKRQLVAMTGLSAAASSLVGLIDRSPLFGDTSLTAPIAMDPVEGRERFALQARTKQPDQAKSKP